MEWFKADCAEASGVHRARWKASRNHEHVHRINRTSRDRPTRVPRRRGEGFVPNGQHSVARESMVAAPRFGILDGLHWVIQLVDNSYGRWPRMERTSFADRCTNDRREV